MSLNEFVNQYGKWIVNTKEYDNGIVRIKFKNPGKTMFLKQKFCEKYDYEVKTSSVLRNSSTYWFKPS